MLTPKVSCVKGLIEMNFDQLMVASRSILGYLLQSFNIISSNPACKLVLPSAAAAAFCASERLFMSVCGERC